MCDQHYSYEVHFITVTNETFFRSLARLIYTHPVTTSAQFARLFTEILLLSFRMFQVRLCVCVHSAVYTEEIQVCARISYAQINNLQFVRLENGSNWLTVSQHEITQGKQTKYNSH